MYTTRGTCGNCGGPVVVHTIWHGVQPQTPRCLHCKAIPATPYGPVLPMQPAGPRRSPFADQQHIIDDLADQRHIIDDLADDLARLDKDRRSLSSWWIDGSDKIVRHYPTHLLRQTDTWSERRHRPSWRGLPD